MEEAVAHVVSRAFGLSGMIRRLEGEVDETFLENSRAVGAALRDAIAEAAAGCPGVRDIRGAGLYVGVEFADPRTGEPDGEAALNIVNELRERRVLISATGAHGNILKIRPPCRSAIATSTSSPMRCAGPWPARRRTNRGLQPDIPRAIARGMRGSACSGYAATRASRSVSSRISAAIFVRADAYCRL
jgi:hypothetical protein